MFALNETLPDMLLNPTTSLRTLISWYNESPPCQMVKFGSLNTFEIVRIQ